MKSKTFALLLLALFVVSSLEAVWAYDAFDIEDFKDSEDVSVNDFSEIEENEFDILSKKSSCKGKKVKSHHQESGRCLSSECKKTCKNDGFKNGKCTKSEESESESDKVKKCYCIKSCKKHKKEKKHKKDDNNSPSISPALPPVDVPTNVVPEYSPTNGPSADTPDSPVLEFPSLPPSKLPISGYTSLEDDDDDSDVSDIY